MQDPLIYKDIEKVLLARFPELWELVEKTFGSYYDLKTELPGAYSVFEDVLQKLLFDLLDTAKDDLPIRRICSFLEEMAGSPDKDVVNLLWIGILQSLVFNRERIRRSWKYLGEKTKQLTRELARCRDWQDNLPPGEARTNGH
jgi:hypothetical protein